MAFSTFGELGQDGEDFVSQAVGFHCAKHGLPRAEDKAQFLEQLAVALMRAEAVGSLTFPFVIPGPGPGLGAIKALTHQGVTKVSSRSSPHIQS